VTKETTVTLCRTIAAATLLTLVPLAGANAADAIALPVQTAEMPLYDDAAGFDWNGFYAGVYGVGRISPVGGTQFGIGIDIGANAQFDFFLIGGEVALQGLTGGAFDTAYGEVLGRTGVVITDEVLLYAAAGYGTDFGVTDSDVLIGGGVELAVNDNVTLRGQYLHGFPITGGNPKDEITFGANYHF
jgi:outer membrane immunogenic protein